MSWLSAHGEVLRIATLAVPRASKTELMGVHDGRLRVRLAAPPVDGAANDELVRFFAQRLDVAKSAVRVAQGSSGRRKTIEVEGLSAAELRTRLARYL